MSVWQCHIRRHCVLRSGCCIFCLPCKFFRWPLHRHSHRFQLNNTTQHITHVRLILRLHDITLRLVTTNTLWKMKPTDWFDKQTNKRTTKIISSTALQWINGALRNQSAVSVRCLSSIGNSCSRPKQQQRRRLSSRTRNLWCVRSTMNFNKWNCRDLTFELVVQVF